MASAHISGFAALALIVAGCGEALPPPPVVDGRACAIAAPDDRAEFGSALKTVRFNDIRFRRRSGHVSCQAYEGTSVCHLSAPRVLHVTRGDQQWWFKPGAGERVVLLVSERGPRCVIDKVQTTEAWAWTHMGATCRSTRIQECP